MQVPSSNDTQAKPAEAAFTDEKFAEPLPLPDYSHKPITLDYFEPTDDLDDIESNPQTNTESQLRDADNDLGSYSGSGDEPSVKD